MEVYPKVKVRQHNEDDDDDEFFLIEDDDSTSFSFMDGFQSLSLMENRSPTSVSFSMSSGKEDLNDSPPTIARISKFHVPKSVIPPISVSKGPVKNVIAIDKDGENFRASPILRPRAVLSSPDNDEMIRNTRQISRVRTSVKKNELGIKEPSEGKIKPRIAKTTNSPNLTKGSKETNLKEKHRLEPTSTKQKPYLRKGKLNT